MFTKLNVFKLGFIIRLCSSPTFLLLSLFKDELFLLDTLLWWKLAIFLETISLALVAAAAVAESPILLLRLYVLIECSCLMSLVDPLLLNDFEVLLEELYELPDEFSLSSFRCLE